MIVHLTIVNPCAVCACAWWRSRAARIPDRRASGISDLVIVVDRREHDPYRFSKRQATTVRAALSASDYAVRTDAGTPVTVVERKSLADLAGALDSGTLVFELAKLAEMPRAAVVVEDRTATC